MKYYDAQLDKDVEIETLQVDDSDDGYVRVDTVEDFEKMVKAQGFDSKEQFEQDCGVKAEELLGKFWLQMRYRVYIKDECEDDLRVVENDRFPDPMRSMDEAEMTDIEMLQSEQIEEIGFGELESKKDVALKDVRALVLDFDSYWVEMQSEGNECMEDKDWEKIIEMCRRVRKAAVIKEKSEAGVELSVFMEN